MVKQRYLHNVVIVTFAFSVLAVICLGERDKIANDAMSVLNQYKRAISILNRVSMEFKSESQFEGETLSHAEKNYFFRADIIYRRDNNRSEWLGNHSAFDNNNESQQEYSTLIRNIMDGEQWIHLGFYNPNISNQQSPRAIIDRNYNNAQKDLFETPMYGGPMDGRIYGNNHLSIADILSQTNNLFLRPHTEKIMNLPCQVLEAKTKYGKINVWVSPEKGYNAIKWSIEKNNKQFYRDKNPADENYKKWKAVFTADEVDEIGGAHIITKGQFIHDMIDDDNKRIIRKCKYVRDDIDLNPEFESMGAFKMDLPEGTIVTYKEFPDIRYRFTKGKLVPVIDDLVINQINKEVDRLFEEKGQTDPSPSNANSPDILDEISTPSTPTKEPPLQIVAETPAKSNVLQSKSYSWLYILLTVAVIVATLLFLRLRRGAFSTHE